MSDSRMIAITSADGEKVPAVLRFSESEDDGVRVELQFSGRAIIRSSDDYFEGLCAIRRQVEPEGIRLLCFGASQNVYPSPMVRSMGYGEKAYRLELGRPARTADLVSIFDSDESVVPATVEEQESFYHEWLESLHEDGASSTAG